MASGAVSAQALRAPLVLSSGIALKGKPVSSSRSISTGASPSALRIRAATNSHENHKVSDVLLSAQIRPGIQHC
jgi:hypothetical protein